MYIAYHFILLQLNPLTSVLIQRDAGLSTLCYSCRFDHQQRVLYIYIYDYIYIYMIIYIYIYVYIFICIYIKSCLQPCLEISACKGKVLASFQAVPVRTESFFHQKRSTCILSTSFYYPVNINLKLFYPFAVLNVIRDHYNHHISQFF